MRRIGRWAVGVLLAAASAGAYHDGPKPGTPPVTPGSETEAVYASRRDEMVKKLRQRAPRYAGAIFAAMGKIPRHHFVPPAFVEQAYEFKWLPNYYGLSVTDPFNVARLLHLLDVRPTHAVLDIGTGSGYSAAVAAELTRHVYTVEIVTKLADFTHQRLDQLGYLGNKMTARQGDGYYGWKEHAPYDRIIVTCAVDHIPVPLIDQLKNGGKMVIPVGPRYQMGKVYLLEKDAEGHVKKQIFGTALFGAMGGHHFQDPASYERTSDHPMSEIEKKILGGVKFGPLHPPIQSSLRAPP